MKPCPNPEYCARIVLDVFVQDFNCSAGNSLPMRSIGVGSGKRNLSAADVESGVAYGKQQTWLEPGPEGTLRLTREGFEEA